MEGTEIIALIVKPTKLTPTEFLASAVSLCIITAIGTGVRFWSNFSHAGRVFLDDYICIGALIFLSWTTAAFYLLLAALNSDPEKVNLEYLTELCAIGMFAATCSLYTAKLPLIFLFIRTFGIKRWVRLTCQILSVLGLMGFMAAAIYPTVGCSPQLHTVNPPFLIACVSSISSVTVPRGSMSLAIDVVLFILPFPIIQTLKLPFGKKLGLVLVFMAGTLAIAASALGLYFSSKKTGDTASNIANALLISVIESSIVILVSCAPAFHLFWSRQTGNLDPSNQCTNASVSRPGISIRSAKRPEDYPMKGGIKVTTHHYVELQDMLNSRDLRPMVFVSAKRGSQV